MRARGDRERERNCRARAPDATRSRGRGGGGDRTEGETYLLAVQREDLVKVAVDFFNNQDHLFYFLYKYFFLLS